MASLVKASMRNIPQYEGKSSDLEFMGGEDILYPPTKDLYSNTRSSEQLFVRFD